MKTSLKNKILEMHFAIWIPFLMILILSFYMFLSQQLIQLRVETLKNQSYQSQMYAIQYLKSAGKEISEIDALKKIAGHFVKYMHSSTGYPIQIYGKSGLLADTLRKENSFPYTEDINKAFESKAYTFFYHTGVKCISFSSPIISMRDNHMGETIGVIRYIYPMNKERIFLLQIMGGICFLSAAILMINVFLSRKNVDSITESVNVLKEAAIIMQNGNLTQEISISSGDEMEELAKTFDIMRRRLQENMARLDEQSEHIQKFYNNVAHQLKTPLTSIIGYSQMIQISDDLDSICEDAFIIEESGEKLLKSIEILLNSSKRIALYSPLNITCFSIIDTINKAIKLLQPRLNRMKVTATNQCDEVYVQTDQSKITEIVLTLMDNALIHSECKHILFFTEQIEHTIYLHIKDDGKGINEEEAKLIFNAFYQGKSNNGIGSGLGLSICASLAKDLKSHLELISTERGAEFVLEIPNLRL